MSILEKRNIKIIDFVKDWNEAVKISIDMLIDDGSVSIKYLDSIYENIKKLGPYILLSPEVVMPHSRPEDGVLKKGISLLKLNNPIDFFDNKTYLYISISATDSNSHIDYIQRIAKVTSEDHILDSIIKSNDIEEIYNIFNNS